MAFPMNNLLITLAMFTIVIHSSNSIQCYVCTNQDVFDGKCLNTIKTCEMEEDTCKTEYSWEYAPHWIEYPVRQYYVTKRCSTNDICEAEKSKTKQLCTYFTYENWKCVECCSDNLCNDHVTMGASTMKSNPISLMGCVAVLIVFHFVKTVLK